MKKTLYVTGIFVLCIFFSCIKETKIDREKIGNCTDGVRNQGEEDVDCGQPCTPCMSCEDGIKNGGETGIDCGGSCMSCAPSCSLSPSSHEYTLFPPGISFSVSDNGSASGYFNPNQSEIEINFNSDPIMNSMTIYLKSGYNPLNFLSLNETMILRTVDNMSGTISSNNQVKIQYWGDIGFDSFYGSIKSGEAVYLTKVSATNLQVRCCGITGASSTSGNDKFSINVITP
jgi:hypothetical protein